ncbi:endo-1,4-beta-xylanase [Patulibacter sp. NPDC049589]|uniref:endo-1,4-beta-xylanase n=1 Tax=Patulibacter sp. NPDC049589 TaxID=3154731 RepID=UPI0034190527
MPRRPSRSAHRSRPVRHAVVAGAILSLALPAAATADQRRGIEGEELSGPAISADATASGGAVALLRVSRRARVLPTPLVAAPAVRLRVGGCRGRLRIGTTTRSMRTVRLRAGWQVVSAPADPGAPIAGVRLARPAGTAGCRHLRLDRIDVDVPPIPLAASVLSGPMRTDARYRKAYLDTFDGLTPENALKMNAARPTPDGYAFEDADELVDDSTAERRPVRGHTLVFDRQLPSWLVNPLLPWTRDTLLGVLRDHVTENVARYRGRVDRWDVVNEAVGIDGRQKTTFWSQGIGTDYIDWAFRFAHAADPTTRLVYNDAGIERPGAHQDGVFRLLSALLARGVPVEGVGLQGHIDPSAPPTAAELDATITRFADLGLRVEITEADVPLGGPATPERIAAQTETYRRLATACWRHVACDRMTVWGVADTASWMGVKASATLLDAAYRPKPALEATRRALAGER